MERSHPRRVRRAIACTLSVALAPLAASISVVATAPPAHAAGGISLTSTYTQNFDTLANSGTASWTDDATLPGWFASREGSGTPSTPTSYVAGTGSSSAGGLYSFGSSSSTERALGSIASNSTGAITYGIRFGNDTGHVVTALAVTYTGEQWRDGGVSSGTSVAQTLAFQYQVGASSLTAGTWTDFSPLDFVSPAVGSQLSMARDGNDAANRTVLTAPITGLNLLPEQAIWLRWQDANDPDSDHALAIDDLSVTATTVTGPVLSVGDATMTEGNSATTDVSFTVSLSEAAPADGVKFDVATADGTATVGNSDYVAKSLTGQTIPEGSTTAAFTVTVNGDTAYEGNETFFVNVTNVTGAFVVDGQGQGTIVDDDACGAPFTTIPSIQGSGLTAAMTGIVTTKGVVVGDFEGTAAASGFYLQDAAGDGDPATSDGIFVYTGAADLVSVGDVVRVKGYARERYGQTTINGSNSNTAAVGAAYIQKCGTATAAATDVTLPFADADAPERYEGMLVRFPQPLVIAEHFNYDQYGEIVLALPLEGEDRPYTGTAVDEPGAAANARTAANALRRITLDDATSGSNPAVLRHPNGQPFSLTNRFRGGDLVANAIGVLGYDFSLYRIYPTAPADHTATNPRPAPPPTIAGSLRVASMNTLNYFLTLDAGAPICGPGKDQECRGADADQPTELTRQRTKLLAAISALGADVVALNELENTPGVDPVADLAAGLNEASAPGTWAGIDTGTIGSDAIRGGLLYKPASVTPVGAFQVLDATDDPRFVDTKNRPSLAQTFEDRVTGGRVTVVVNHFKSKGSDCLDLGDADVGDGQGNCNVTRTNAARALVDWLATDPTGSGDPDFLIVGDLNSYAKEDPVRAITAGPDDMAATADDYRDLLAAFEGAHSYSYTFDGQSGSLDHALANASLHAQVVAAATWHANADEPDAVDYDTSYKPASQAALYEPNAYRSSDHDPLVVSLVLTNAAPVLGAATVTPNPAAVGATVTAAATITDADTFDVHTATVDWGDGTTTAATVSEAAGTGALEATHAYATAGTFTVTVTVDDGHGHTDTTTTQAVVVDTERRLKVNGWIAAAAGAYVPMPSAAGKVELDADVRYKKGDLVPDGKVHVRFKAARVDLRSTSLDWLVTAGGTGLLHGTARIGDVDGYTFLLAVEVGRPDRVRLTVWAPGSGAVVVFDNGSLQALGGGNIEIKR